MPIARYHLYKNIIGTDELIDRQITRPKLAAGAIQNGRTSVSFDFTDEGAENQSATIPAVICEIEDIDVHKHFQQLLVQFVNISVTANNFTVTVRDDAGTDYTTSQTATVNWVAIAI